MYGFMRGFQRRVWWPKWTPASSNSRRETVVMCVLPRVGLVDRRGAARPARPEGRESTGGDAWIRRGIPAGTAGLAALTGGGGRGHGPARVVGSPASKLPAGRRGAGACYRTVGPLAVGRWPLAVGCGP